MSETGRLLYGMLYVLWTGCQWKMLPREYYADSTTHKYFQQWTRKGVFRKMWQLCLVEYDELRGVEWKWQILDSQTVQSPVKGEKTGKNPTDRGKLGTKRHVLFDQNGIPLAVVLTGANMHDSKAHNETWNSIIVVRPDCSAEVVQHACEDKAYDSE